MVRSVPQTLSHTEEKKRMKSSSLNSKILLYLNMQNSFITIWKEIEAKVSPSENITFYAITYIDVNTQVQVAQKDIVQKEQWQTNTHVPSEGSYLLQDPYVHCDAVGHPIDAAS